MKVKQRVKKVLHSALIFAMVIALCGTTLAKAYATYFPVVIEHVWKDNGNTWGPNEKGEPAGEDEKEPAGEDEKEPAGEDEKEPTGEDEKEPGPRDLVGSLEVSYTGEGDMDRYYANLVEWSTLDDSMTFSPNGDGTTKITSSNQVVMDGSNEIEVDAETLADDLIEKFKDAGAPIDEKHAAAAAQVVLDALQEAEDDVWVTVDKGPSHESSGLKFVDGKWVYPKYYGYGLGLGCSDLYTMSVAELTQESKDALKAQGYETELKITIVVSEYDTPDSECHTYVTTDDGKTWIDADTKEPVTSDEVFYNSEYYGIIGCTYTFIHTRAASYEPAPEPDPDPDPTPDPDPKDPDPTPDPDPKDPDPTPDPDPKVPDEEIPDPDVPLSDIPQTGDISDLWYGTALMAAVGLIALLYQERRSKKTA